MSHKDPITKETRTPPRLVIQQSAAGFVAGQMLVLEGDVITVGRDACCTFRFDESGVSRKHATIVRDGEGLTITDNNSTNGTWVNGRSISQCRLREGDELRLGASVILRFQWQERSENLAHAVASA